MLCTLQTEALPELHSLVTKPKQSNVAGLDSQGPGKASAAVTHIQAVKPMSQQPLPPQQTQAQASVQGNLCL